MKKIWSLKFWIVSLGILILLGLLTLVLISKIYVKMQRVEIIPYDTISLSDELIAKINENGPFEDSSFYANSSKMKMASNHEYGTLFELVYHFDLKRIVPIYGCQVFAVVDLSDLSDEENIFFADSTADVYQEDIFAINSEKYVAPFPVCLVGCTYGYSEEQIRDIITKIKIHIYIESVNGKRKEIIRQVKTDDIQFVEPDEEDMKFMEGYFKY